MNPSTMIRSITPYLDTVEIDVTKGCPCGCFWVDDVGAVYADNHKVNFDSAHHFILLSHNPYDYFEFDEVNNACLKNDNISGVLGVFGSRLDRDTDLKCKELERVRKLGDYDYYDFDDLVNYSRVLVSHKISKRKRV